MTFLAISIILKKVMSILYTRLWNNLVVAISSICQPKNILFLLGQILLFGLSSIFSKYLYGRWVNQNFYNKLT